VIGVAPRPRTIVSNSAPATEDSGSRPSCCAPVFVLWVCRAASLSPLPSSQVEWAKMPWIHVLSGTIWNPSTASSIATAWISSLQASPARAPASPESASASTTSDGSGRSCGATCSTSELDGSSSKTCPASSALTVAERSRKSSGIWHARVGCGVGLSRRGRRGRPARASPHLPPCCRRQPRRRTARARTASTG
jgi:hypothetical protein